MKKYASKILKSRYATHGTHIGMNGHESIKPPFLHSILDRRDFQSKNRSDQN